MAPGSSNNQNNNANNNNNRQTGTKPKSKSSKKNSVPQEMVAPTRRDLQQQLNVLVDWATVSGASSVVQNNHPQHHYTSAQPSTSGQQQQQHPQSQQGQNILLKPRNNRTPGEGTCYEIDSLSLQDNSRYIPVRPIVRRNLLNEGSSGEQNEPHNTAVGVVIPTTPNSTLQQTFRLSEGASGGIAGPSSSGAAYSWSINNLLHNSTGHNNPLQAHGGAGAGSAGAGTNATGVIPKQQQPQQQHILNPLLLLQHQAQQGGQSRSTSSPLSYRVPDGASQNQLNLNKNSNQDQQLHQQQSQQQQQQQTHHLLTAAVPSTSSGTRNGAASFATAHPFGSTSGRSAGIASTVEDTLNQIQEYIKLTTNLISSVQIDNLNSGPRPQSVQSVRTNQSTTPVPTTASCDELRYRMETQSKNMQALKDQQAHLLRLQQAARQQLQEMESIRQQHVATVAPPVESFQTVEQVQDGIGSIMERMRVLSTFIHNQQELSNMLGGDNEDVLADQAMLQQKFQELRDKKSQMHSLVSELQNMNLDANRQFEGGETGEHSRTVPIELTHIPATAADARNATKTFTNECDRSNSMEAAASSGATSKVTPHRQLENDLRNGHEDDGERPLNEEESVVLTGTADMLSEKINEINAMKSQLRRLKEMMDTVKLIEMKTGHESIDEEDEDEEEEEDAPEDEEEAEEEEERNAAAFVMQRRSRSRSMSSAPITLLPNGTTIPSSDAGMDGNEISNQEREHLNKRVEALQAMTQDLREQAKSIAAERDRLKHARNDLQKRRNNVVELQQQAQTSEKLTNHVASFESLGPKERQQMELNAALENKRRELERIEKMTQSIKKNADLSRSSVGAMDADDGGSHVRDGPGEVGSSGVGGGKAATLAAPPGPSSVVSSSVDSCSGSVDRGSLYRGTPLAHPLIPPPPAPSAISGSLQNNTAGSNATNDSKTNSADSGVTSDIFAHAQLESASYQSSSTRSFPPPMPDICNRNTAADRYRAKRGGGGTAGNGNGGGPSADADVDRAAASASVVAAAAIRDHTSPWPMFGPSTGAGMSSSNTGPHSPAAHYGHPVYGGGMHDLSHHHHASGGYGGAYGSSWSTGGGPYGVAANLLPPHTATPNTPPDPIVFQHIMQTQQMLMNSITQCNQLLWIQQREINNLNNAVLLLQERILGTNSTLLLHDGHVQSVGASLIRAESTPPNNGSNMSMSNAPIACSSIYARARSEQPMMSHHQHPQMSPYTHYPHNPSHVLSSTSSGVVLQQQQQQQQLSQQAMQSFNPQHNQQSPYSPLASGMTHNHSILSTPLLTTSGTAQQPSGQCAVNQQIQRNNTNLSQIGLPPSGRSFRASVRPLNINTLNNALYDDAQAPVAAAGMANNNAASNAANESAGLVGGGEYGPTLTHPHHLGAAPNMINNLCSQSSQPATPTPVANGTMLPLQATRYGQNFNNLNNHNATNNLSNANSATVTNMQQQQHSAQQNNLYNQQQDSSSQQQQHQQQTTQALNNQVLPGVRANNYWDNFRSYSRQNLLSSNSCKSNEESGSYSGGSGGGGGGGGAGSSSCGASGTGIGGTAGGTGGTVGSGQCNTINNQLQRNNSNASNQYMNNQSNKYQQTINITRNNSLSNANQANNMTDMGSGPSQQMSYQQQLQQQDSMIDECAGQAGNGGQNHHQSHGAGSGHLQQQAPPGMMSAQFQPQQQQQQQQTHQHHHNPVSHQTIGQQQGAGPMPSQSHHAYHQHPQPQPMQSLHQKQYLSPAPTVGSPAAVMNGAEPQPASSGHNQHAPQQHASHHTPLNQSNSLELGELQFHTNPINLGLANKTHPKASGHKKYALSLRSCRDAGTAGEGSSGCYVSGGGDMNLASTCTYQHDSKSTSKLFEALKENVYQEVKNLITANESRPHFLIQLFRELQLISSDPLRQRTLQSIQELYNRYIESTLQEENHVNNVGSNNLLTSSGTSLLGEAGGGGGGAVGGVPVAAVPVVDEGGSIGEGIESSSVTHEGRNPAIDLSVELEVVQNYTNLRQQQQQQQQQHQYHFGEPSGSAGGNLQQSAVSSGSSAVAGGGEQVTTSTPNQSTNGVSSSPVGGGIVGPNRPAGNQEQLVPLAVANSEIINIIMGDIVAVINSVDYINDSVLFKIAGVICNHAAAGNGANQVDYGHPDRPSSSVTAGGGVHHHHHHQHHYHHHHAAATAVPQPQSSRVPPPGAAVSASATAANSLLAAASFLSSQSDHEQQTGVGGGESVFSREDFLRHLESWNRTDKDEFISNLENFLNNILLRSSAVEAEAEEEEDAIEAAGPSIMVAGGGGGGVRLPGPQTEPYGSSATSDAVSYEGYSTGASGRRASGSSGVGVLRSVGDGNPFIVDHRPQESAVVVVSSSSASNGYASTTYDLAEADQVCDLDSAVGSQPGGVGTAASTAGSASGSLLPMGQPTLGQHPPGHSLELATTFDDRWTVVVQKKPVVPSLPDNDTPTTAPGSGNGTSVNGGGMSRMGVGSQQPQQHIHQQLHNTAGGHNSSTSGTSNGGAGSGGGNNGNNINNNWQSEEVADQHLENTEEQHSSYY